MNKTMAVGIGAVALLALFVWFYSSTPPQSSEIMTATSTPTTETPSQTPAATKASPTPTKGVINSQTSYKSLLTQSGSYQCDYEQVQTTGQSRSVIYLYGGKMRGEFRTSVNGVTNANLFVYDGRYMYQWKEGTSVGTKTVLSSLSQLPLAIPKDLTSGAIVGNNFESVGWICHTWLTNKSLLAPPSYVTFK